MLFLLDERPFLIFLEGGTQFLFGVHHDRAVPGDRLAQRLAGDEQEAHAFDGGGCLHLVPVTEDHQAVVVQVGVALQVKVILADFVVIKRVLFHAETGFAFKDIGKAGMAALHRAGESLVGRHGHIQVFRLDDDIL